eukprot:11124884-Heterocapsa_arctica.AAC.1
MAVRLSGGVVCWVGRGLWRLWVAGLVEWGIRKARQGGVVMGHGTRGVWRGAGGAGALSLRSSVEDVRGWFAPRVREWEVSPASLA